MASKKNFSNKKPEFQVQAEAVEAFLGNAPAPDPEAKEEETPVSMPEKVMAAQADSAGHEEESPAPALSPAPFSRKAKVNKENKRSKRLQLLITEDEYNYLSAVAWMNRRSVNDYMNMLIEQDMQKNPEAKFVFKGDK